MSTDTTQVIVVGGGPTGLITALGLAQRGVEVVVLERSADVVPAPRAMNYHWAVLAGLDELGVLEDMEAEGFRLDALSYRVFATGEVIRLGIDVVADRTPHPYSVILGQDRLARIVLDHLGRLGNTRVVWSAEVSGVDQDDDGVTVRAAVGGRDTTYRAGWVIGADGARSVVRKAACIGFEGWTWPEQFVATDVRYDLGAHGWDDSNYLVDPHLGAVIARVTREGLWRVTFSQPADAPAETVEDRIDAYYRRVLPEPGPDGPAAYSVYTMHQRTATTLRLGRLLLAGDAAHATNPTNGFGLVSGIMDSFVLADALAAVVAGRAPASVLDRYSDDRRRVFDEVATPSSSETKRLVFHSDDPVRLEADLAELRAMAADPVRRAGRLMVGAALLTPSPVS